MDLETVHGILMLDDSQLLASEEFILKMNAKGSLSKFMAFLGRSRHFKGFRTCWHV